MTRATVRINTVYRSYYYSKNKMFAIKFQNYNITATKKSTLWHKSNVFDRPDGGPVCEFALSEVGDAVKVEQYYCTDGKTVRMNTMVYVRT